MVNSNLKFLRTRQGLTQKQFAEKLGLKQSAIGAYEERRATPPLACLLQISRVFGVSLDVLTQKDLSKLPEKEWKWQMPRREVLAITVDNGGKENVELVTQKASAGYLNGYQDPEYIAELPRVSIPVLPRNATYRAFEIKGDSMLPLQPGTIVFGEYVEDPGAIKSGKLYVVVTRDEGIVFKRVYNLLKEEGRLLLVSDNRAYPPYPVKAEDILEMWSARGFFSMKFPEAETPETIPADHLAMTVVRLQDEVRRLKGK
ncbi:MAG: LexA family transcriptional regulator [Cyclobacteriaceae bacterium]|jgi:transcriptional regulator with XRE-family HTH domain|nr:LexA family transcriptional regulator [Cyclobacteriaceae bacterium]